MNRFCSIFSQLLTLFPRLEFDGLVKAQRAEHHARGFTCWEQFVRCCSASWGGRRVLATIADRAVVTKMLTRLGWPVDLPKPAAARTPAWLPGVRAAADYTDHSGGHGAD